MSFFGYQSGKSFVISIRYVDESLFQNLIASQFCLRLSMFVLLFTLDSILTVNRHWASDEPNVSAGWCSGDAFHLQFVGTGFLTRSICDY